MPMPPRVLSPNARVHWAKRAQFAKEFRQLAHWKTHALILRAGPKLKAARVEYVFHFQNRRRRDVDNFSAMMKPALDGIVDAGLLADDDCVTLTARCGDNWPDCPGVEIRIEEQTK